MTRTRLLPPACVSLLLLLTPACLLGAEQQPTTMSVRAFGAVGDGKTDDTAALQKAVNSGIGDIILCRGTYLISKPIVIDLDKVGYTSIVGSGTATIIMSGSGPAIKFIGTHGGTADPSTVKPPVYERQRMPTVDGIEIVGAHAEAVGIEAVGTMKLVVTRVTVRKALHGIHLTKRNRNVIVSNCHLYENRGVGLYLDNVNLHQINVTGCHISYNAGGGIVSRGGNVRNLQINGCDIEGNMSPKTPPTANVLIDCSGKGHGTAEITIVGCTIQHSSNAPNSANIRYIGTNAKGKSWGHFTIANNVFSDVHVNIDIQKARGVVIVGNTFWQGCERALQVSDSTNVVVGANAFDRNPNYVWGSGRTALHGVIFSNCKDCTLSGLHINGVHKHPAGLVLKNCRRMNVTNCTVLDCDNAGILLDNVTQSRVSNCLISNDNQKDGVWVPIVMTNCRDNMINNNMLGTSRAQNEKVSGQ